MKTLVSFDIGIKNLAFCVFGLQKDSLTVRDWGVINLSEASSSGTVSTVPLCSCLNAKSSSCSKKAAYCLDTNFYCKVHAKTSGKLLPSKEIAMPAIRKMKVDELIASCSRHFVSFDLKDKKAEILQKAQTHFEKCTLKEIKKPKKTNANQIHLVEIGKRIKTHFDEKFHPFMEELSNVILENQISPIAGRMNTIQGMVAQYFIMRASNELQIDFISSSGKLKGLDTSGTAYKDHKKDGIRFCGGFMESNGLMVDANLKTNFETSTKKDDLADCFLQGVYFLKKQNILNYSDDLKINFVQ